MFPLIVLALGLGAALVAYEFSPKARSRIDTYARAIQSAHVAHRTADVHLDNARASTATAERHAQQADAAARQVAAQPVPALMPMPMPTPMPAPTPMHAPTPMPAPMPTIPAPTREVVDVQAPSEVAVEAAVAEIAAEAAAEAAADTAADHVVAATEANQAAAKDTAEAAAAAQTQAERQEAAESAAKVVERERQIQAALDSLGLGQCDVRTYKKVTERVKDALLAKLRSEGMTVAGNNPWNINTGIYGVKLRAVWDWRVDELKLIVTAGKNLLVSCPRIWERIDPKVKGIIGSWHPGLAVGQSYYRQGYRYHRGYRR